MLVNQLKIFFLVARYPAMAQLPIMPAEAMESFMPWPRPAQLDLLWPVRKRAISESPVSSTRVMPSGACRCCGCNGGRHRHDPRSKNM